MVHTGNSRANFIVSFRCEVGNKSDRIGIFLCVIDYLDSAETYNWIGNNTLVVYTNFWLQSTITFFSEQEQYTLQPVGCVH
jgi:hypothetical protein